MNHHNRARSRALAALALALLVSAGSLAAEVTAAQTTRFERKGLNAMVTRILEKDFKLVPVRAADGAWQVGLAVRAYTKTATEKGVRVEPHWDTSWAKEIGSWTNLRVSVALADGYCGGQGRSFVVTIASRQDGTPIKTYAVFAGDSLARLDYMDIATCTE
jgi:hypothetical protein